VKCHNLPLPDAGSLLACDAMANPRAVLVVAIGCWLAPRAARASGELSLHLHTGVNLGRSIYDQAGDGFVLGGESSLVLLHLGDDDGADVDHDTPGIPMIGTPTWVGIYGDVLRDTGSDTTRISFGPELGHELIGVDGGLLVQLGDQRRWGFTVRPVLTVGVLAIYGRWGHFLDDEPRPDVVEAGLLVKLPLRLWGSAPR
jgi:hypothetical protein